MIEICKENESFMRIDCDFDEALNISEYFSFYVTNYRFMPKYRAGIWDGKIKLFNMNNRLIPIGLGKRLIQYLHKNNYRYKIVESDHKYDKLQYGADGIKLFAEQVLNIPYTMDDYQLEGVVRALKDNKCILESPTGSGKSLIIYVLLQLLRHEHPDFKFLLIVPTISLVHQMKGDFLEYAKNNPEQAEWINKSMQLIHGGKDRRIGENTRIVCSTWQSIIESKMPKSWYTNFSGLIVDEVQEGLAKQIKTINENCINAVYKVGTTGTVQDDKVDRITLVSLFGEVYTLTKTKTLMDKGRLTKVKINNFILKYPKETRKLVGTTKRKNMSGEWVSGMGYFDESKLIREYIPRLKFIIALSLKLKGNTLILFKDVEGGYGKKIADILTKQGKDVFYIDGSVNHVYRNDIRSVVEEHDNAYIVASLGTFARGVNIKKLNNIIFAEPSKSKIKVLQSIGRSIRKHESKDIATIYDIVDEIKYKNRKNYVYTHFEERLKVYESQEFDYRIIEKNI